MIISHDLLPAQKRRKQNLKVNIDVYQYATELLEELDALGIVVSVCVPLAVQFTAT